MQARVEIHLKEGVSDPEGENVRKALNLLGFTSVAGVRSIKVFDIDLADRTASKARAAVEEMCRKLLANPVIHDYRIVVRGGRSPGTPR